MRGKKSDREFRKVTARFFATDIEFLKAAYPTRGYNEILRALTSRHVRALREATVERLGKLTDEELKSF